jgi:hypothetical protein
MSSEVGSLSVSHVERSTLKDYWFTFSIILIAAISVYDTYLIVRYQSEIADMEENPIGCWLLEVNNGCVGLFVRTKLAGTVCVLSTLIGMWMYRSRIVFPVTTSVASYQAALFAYLTVV